MDTGIWPWQGTGTQPEPLPDAPVPQLPPRPPPLTLEQPDDRLSRRWWEIGRHTDAPRCHAQRLRIVCPRATPNTHSVATDNTNQCRATRFGSVRRVRCHCHPMPFSTRKPSSIHIRSPYQRCCTCCGAKSVSNTQRSACPWPHTITSVPVWRACSPNTAAVPIQARPGHGTRCAGGSDRLRLAGRTGTPSAIRSSGCRRHCWRWCHNRGLPKPRSTQTKDCQSHGTSGAS